jgi:hypothetical protein
MKHCGRGVGKRIKDLDESAFFRDKDPAIRRKADSGRLCQAGEDDGF